MFILHYNMIQICSGITSGRVLNGEFYAQILQKLIYLHLLTGCFMKISLQSSGQNVVGFQPYQFFIYNNLMKQPVSMKKHETACKQMQIN